MYLNDGDLNRDKIAEFKSAKNLLNYLVSSRNMVADIIINNQKKIASSIATFSVDSGYVVASVDIRIAFDKLVDFNAIEINVHPANEPNSVYVSSYTDGFSEAIPANDVDADIYFKAGSLYPYNNLKFAIAESKFNSTRTQTMQTISYDKLPSVVDTDDSDDGGDDSHPVTPSIPTATRVSVYKHNDNYAFEVTFDSLSDVSSIVYTVNYEQAPVVEGTGSSNPSGNNIYFSLPIEGTPDIQGLIEYTSEGILELDLEIHDLYDNPVDTLTLSPTDGISEWLWYDQIPVEPTTVQVTVSTSAVSGPGNQPDSEITSYLYKYDSPSNTWQPNKWGSSLECNANGTNFIIVGVYNPMKQVSVEPVDGVENIEVSPAPDNDDIYNIKTETGAVAVYQISFMPTFSTSLIIKVEDVTEEP